MNFARHIVAVVAWKVGIRCHCTGCAAGLFWRPGKPPAKCRVTRWCF